MPAKIETKKGNITYEEDPVEFCQMIYDEAVKRNEDLASINEENRLFYEGYDNHLKTRGANQRVVRSNLFIPEMTPAIDTRIGDILSRIDEQEEPLRVIPNSDDLTSAEQDQAIFIQQQLNKDLRESGYLTDIFREHWLGAEIYRTPSAVKVGWGRGHRMVAQADTPSPNDVAAAALENKILTPSVRFVKREISGPFVDWLPPDQFLYEPNRSDFHKTSRYAIHAQWMTWDELFASAYEQEWDVAKIKKFKEEISNEASGERKETHQERIDEGKQTPQRVGFKQDRVLVTENYISTFDPLGREKTNLAIMVGNKILVKNTPSPYMAIKFPFEPIVANRLPGTIEGLSSVDRVKGLQRLFNEIFNSWIDAITYRIFPPFKKNPGNTFTKQPIYGPAEIWELVDPDGLKPVIENIGDLPDLVNLMIAVAAKIRQTLGAPDINQGFTSTPYEKATSVSLRATGAVRKASTTYKNAGLAIVRVAEMFLFLNQQFHEEAHRFVMDVTLDVPTLTDVLDPEQEKQDAILLHELLAKEQIYNMGKIGLQKRRALIDHIVRIMLRRKGSEFRITEEELNQILEAQQMAQEAALDEQAAVKKFQVETQGVQ